MRAGGAGRRARRVERLAVAEQAAEAAAPSAVAPAPSVRASRASRSSRSDKASARVGDSAGSRCRRASASAAGGRDPALDRRRRGVEPGKGEDALDQPVDHLARRRASAGSAWFWISSRLSRSRREQVGERHRRADLGRGERIEDRAAGGRQDLDRRSAGHCRPTSRPRARAAARGGTVSASGDSVASKASSARRCAAGGTGDAPRLAVAVDAHKRSRRRRATSPRPRPGSGGAARSARTRGAGLRLRLARRRARPGRSARSRRRGPPSSARARRPDRRHRPTGCRADGRRIGRAGASSSATKRRPCGQRRLPCAAAPSASVRRAVEPVDREPVPAADAGAVGVGEIGRAVHEADPRRRIVHHRIAALGRAPRNCGRSRARGRPRARRAGGCARARPAPDRWGRRCRSAPAPTSAW